MQPMMLFPYLLLWSVSLARTIATEPNIEKHQRQGRSEDAISSIDSPDTATYRSKAIPKRRSLQLSKNPPTLNPIHLPTRPSPPNTTQSLTTPTYPINCFNPYTTRLRPAFTEDCHLIINHIILTYPSPMTIQTFGYSDSVDFDLREKGNERWVHEGCVIFVRSMNKRGVDRFRMVDVAVAAERVVEECVEGVKYAVGGTTDVGSGRKGFYVGVGGRAGGISERRDGEGDGVV